MRVVSGACIRVDRRLRAIRGKARVRSGVDQAVSSATERRYRIPMGCRGGPGTNDPGLFICENYSRLNMVLHAYSVEYYQLSAPDWMLTTRFDLRATVPEGATKEQLPLTLQ